MQVVVQRLVDIGDQLGYLTCGKLAEAMKRQTPLRKLATPEDVASAIAFLGSGDAGHITGQVLSVSGGLTMV